MTARRASAAFLASLLIMGCAAASEPRLQRADLSRLRKEISSLKGKAVLLEFWATWCEPCVRNFPALVRLHNRYRRQGLEIIAVSVDSPEREKLAKTVLKKNKARFRNFLKWTDDDDAFIRGVHPEWEGGLPASFLYDRSGRLRYKHFELAARGVLEKQIKELLRASRRR